MLRSVGVSSTVLLRLNQSQRAMLFMRAISEASAAVAVAGTEIGAGGGGMVSDGGVVLEEEGVVIMIMVVVNARKPKGNVVDIVFA